MGLLVDLSNKSGREVWLEVIFTALLVMLLYLTSPVMADTGIFYNRGFVSSGSVLALSLYLSWRLFGLIFITKLFRLCVLCFDSGGLLIYYENT